jgi:hypothetical protein
MASIPVTIQGVLFYTGLEVGGGPMPGGPGGQPGGGLGIWGGAPIGPNPPGVWPGPGQPPGIWGGAPIGPNPPRPDQGLPGQPPSIWPSPGYPSHPWIPPGGPGIWPSPPEGQGPGIWPGPGFGNQPSHPISPGGQPGKPSFPIWGPPGVTLPPGTGYPPVAGHPLPPEGGDGGEPPKPIAGFEARTAWTPDTGWVVVIVPTEGTNVPTPSGQQA